MKGSIAWFVRNPIAANLLMWLIIIGGISSLPNMNRELYPDFPADTVSVSIAYPGGAPEEVEEQISIRLEEAVHDLDGIDQLVSYSNRGSARMDITVIPGYNTQEMLNDVKARVDAINVLPQDAERAQIFERVWRRDILEVAVAAQMDENSLKQLAEQVKDGLRGLPGVDYVDIEGTRVSELSISVAEQDLKRFNLTFAGVAEAIRRSSVNLSAGRIRTEQGSLQLRTTGQAYEVEDFENIVIVQQADGTRVRLGEIATVQDSFEDVRTRTRFNGKPAVFVEVFNMRDPDVIAASAVVHEHVDLLRERLPEGVNVEIWNDRSVSLEKRINLLAKNAISGLILVFILLMLFLRPLLAFWVAMGIGISYLGTLAMMPLFGVSINVLSLFAFLLILGIVVDDAIMVGESIHARHESGFHGDEAAIRGARGVFQPVSIAIITTLMVFGSMLLLPSQSMRIFTVIPLVALPALAISLLESFVILPAHLRHMKAEVIPKNRILRFLHNLRIATSGWLRKFSQQRFAPWLARVIEHRQSAVALFCGVFILVMALLGGGWLKFEFWPKISSERLRGNIALEENLPFEQVEQVAHQVEAAVERLRHKAEFLADNGQPIIEHLRVIVRDTQIKYRIQMLGAELHTLTSRDLEKALRKEIGPIPNVETFESYSSMGKYSRKALNYEIRAADGGLLDEVTRLISDHLRRINGIIDVEDSLKAGMPELEFSLKEGAESLGIGLSDIARQLRQGFYGEEVQRIPRLNEDIKVMVRYPLAERNNINSLENFRVRSSDGREVPLSSVVNADYTMAPPTIIRTNRQRSVTISGDLIDDDIAVEDIHREVFNFFQEHIEARYPSVRLSLGGAEQDQKEFESAFEKVMWLVIFGIYGLIAVLFRSYWQPLLVIMAIPFGLAGALIGHFVLGMNLSIMSMCGMLAAVGVVVNDSLVLIARINQLRLEGLTAAKSVVQAAQDRFRPIVLTSVTTFCGLMPILLERSTQAKWLIPTAVSLSWGVMAATFVTLIMVPCVYLMGENVKEAIRGWFGKGIKSEA